MIAQLVGKFVIAYFVWIFVSNVYWRLVRPPTDWSMHKGEWAIVTGSSYGIGSEFALSLAKRGINVVLCARTQYKLEEIEKNIKQLYPQVKTKILLMDVVQDGWEKSLEEIRDLNVSVLVNNVGGGNLDGKLRLFHEFSDDQLQTMHKLNLYSTQKIILKFLPQMFQRRKGRIINVSSCASFLAHKLGVYPGDKAFVNQLTEQLNTEYEEYNIRAEALVVGEVSTPAIGFKEVDGFRVCSPSTITENALDLWGWSEIYSPFWGHAFIVMLTRTVLPMYITRPLLRYETEEISKDVSKGNEFLSNIRINKDL